MQDAFVYQGLRTPFGKVGGALSGQRPDDLAALVISELVAQAPGLDPENAGEIVGEVIFGNANGAGEENRNVARMGPRLVGREASGITPEELPARFDFPVSIPAQQD